MSNKIALTLLYIFFVNNSNAQMTSINYHESSFDFYEMLLKKDIYGTIEKYQNEINLLNEKENPIFPFKITGRISQFGRTLNFSDQKINNAYLYSGLNKEFSLYLLLDNNIDVITRLLKILGEPICVASTANDDSSYSDSKIYDSYNWEINSLEIILHTYRQLFDKTQAIPEDLVLIVTNMRYIDLFIFTEGYSPADTLINTMPDSLHSTGWRNIQLGNPIESIKPFITPFSQSRLKDLLHTTPSEDVWFVYNDMPYQCKTLTGVVINHILIAVSDDQVIKRIKFYITDSHNELDAALSKQFGEQFIGNSTIDGVPFNQHYLWNIPNGIVLYLLKPGGPVIHFDGSDSEMTFSFLRDTNETGKYVVYPRFK